MSTFFTSLLTNVTKYFSDNLSCLSYAGDVIVSKYLIYTSYYDLLVDISEGFGVWVSITVLVLALLSLLVVIHDTEVPATNTPLKKLNPKKGGVANSLSYSSFTKFIGAMRNRL
jgi:hypothetical protein